MLELPEHLASEISMPYLSAAHRSIALTGGGYWPTLIKMSNGTLAALLRQGSPHVGLRSSVAVIMSHNAGETWEAPITIVPASDQWDNRAGAFCQMPNGDLFASYVEATWYRGWKFDQSVGGIVARCVRSSDGGTTWSAPQPLGAELGDSDLAVYGRICVLPDGQTLLTAYRIPGGNEEDSTSVILRSQDNGLTWGDESVIARGFNETTVTHLPDGRLLAFMRCEGRAVGVYQASSDDMGYTWTTPKRLTVEHQHPADACVLPSGRLLLSYGNRIGPLAAGVMLSDDLGESWHWDNRVILARDTLVLRDKSWGDCGYPSTVQADDGTIVTLYYRLGDDKLPAAEQEKCLDYERMVFLNPPAPDDMRRFEQAVCVRYTEDQLLTAAGMAK